MSLKLQVFHYTGNDVCKPGMKLPREDMQPVLNADGRRPWSTTLNPDNLLTSCWTIKRDSCGLYFMQDNPPELTNETSSPFPSRFKASEETFIGKTPLPGNSDTPNCARCAARSDTSNFWTRFVATIRRMCARWRHEPRAT